jgi:ketosteroid isomerase-like protein
MDLQEISDRLEIQELMVEYAYAIDNRDWDALDNVFTADAFIDYSEMAGVKGTLPEIKAFLDDAMKQVAACQHGISTTQLKIQGDRAVGRTICTNPMEIGDGGHVMLLGLWYHDEFVRTEKGWRISSRSEENSWRYNVPPGLLPEPSRTRS